MGEVRDGEVADDMGTAVVNTQQRLSQKKRKKFLRLLSQTGNVLKASRAVGYQDSSFLNRLRREDEDFAREWGDALDSAADRLEEEADRRAVEGIDKPVFYKGEVVGYVTEYSDALLMFRLRAMRPDRYNPKQGDTNVNVKFGIAVLPMTAPNAALWEQQAIEVHANQEVIVLDPVPENTKIPANATIKRSD